GPGAAGAAGVEAEGLAAGAEDRSPEDSAETPAFLATRERGADQPERMASGHRDELDEDAPAFAQRRAADVRDERRLDDERRFEAERLRDERPDDDDRYDERPRRPGGLAALAGLGGLFRRDPRPRAGAPRAIRPADIDHGA